MKKIEKMSGYSEVTMKLKVNEIIDRLNQSVSQPEGNIYEKWNREELETRSKVAGFLGKKGKVTVEKDKVGFRVENNTEGKTLEKMQDEFDREKVRDYAKVSLETYKQATQDNTEEWWKELREKWNLYTYSERNDNFTTCDMEIKEFIEQLLSERSFSKEELEEIYENIRSTNKTIAEKVDRLLHI